MKDHKEILLGCEAIALGAIHAGISGAYSYPGTPSTEIMEFVQQRGWSPEYNICAQWSTNEKVALEEALGMSFAGKRVLVSMKHVGLNVAADPFMGASITGVNGGFVLAVADDPSMHSSQNEQDSRFLADFAQIITYEPFNQQVCYELTREAFDVSERFHLPVLIRIPTRLSHSRSEVHTRAKQPQNELNPPAHFDNWTLLPSNARIQYGKLLDKQADIKQYTEDHTYNQIFDGRGKIGVITSGTAVNYFREVFERQEMPPYMTQVVYPLPVEKIRRFATMVDEIVVLEESYPFIERQLNGIFGQKIVHGRLDGYLPKMGELNPDLIKKALDADSEEVTLKPQMELPNRPPQLCKGCPHIDTFNALQAAKKALGQPVTFGDIGCYTLGFYEPYQAITSCVDMGASVGMARGAADAGMQYVSAVIGDSTFSHSGISSLISAMKQNTPMTLIIADNSTVAMTGGQTSMTTRDELYDILVGIGIPKAHIRIIMPLPKNHLENTQIIKEELEYNGLSVVISARECIQKVKK